MTGVQTCALPISTACARRITRYTGISCNTGQRIHPARMQRELPKLTAGALECHIIETLVDAFAGFHRTQAKSPPDKQGEFNTAKGIEATW